MKNILRYDILSLLQILSNNHLDHRWWWPRGH